MPKDVKAHQGHGQSLPDLYNIQWVQKYLQKTDNYSEDNSVEYNNRNDSEVKLPTITK